jgi:hypothetical protein
MKRQINGAETYRGACGPPWQGRKDILSFHHTAGENRTLPHRQSLLGPAIRGACPWRRP